MRFLVRIIPVVIFCLSVFIPSLAARADCPAGRTGLAVLIAQGTKAAVDEKVQDLAEKAARDTPRAAAMSQQNAAPSVSGTAATLVNAAGFSELIAAAFDRDIGNGSSDALTLNVNPFTLAAIGKPAVYYDQTLYERPEYEWLRRVSGTASFGGKGEAFDRDGDGTIDDALDSENFDDIVGWEVRARVWGSRDRREEDNFQLFLDRTNSGNKDLVANMQMSQLKFLQAFRSDPDVSADLGPVAQNLEQCLSDSVWEQVQNKPAIRQLYQEMLDAAVEANAAYAAAADEIDNRMLWTVAVVGLTRDKQFGPDKIGTSVRGTWLGGTFNFDWMNVDGIGGAKDSNEFKVGLRYATQIFKGGYLTNGIDAALAAAYEAFDNVPDAAHDDNVKIQGQLEIPIMDGVTVPLSITWANHEDLFDENDQVIGRFGINIDTSKLLQRVNPLLPAASGS